MQYWIIVQGPEDRAEKELVLIHDAQEALRAKTRRQEAEYLIKKQNVFDE